jgi:hypothetical protein
LKSIDRKIGVGEMKTKTWINLIITLVLLVVSFGVMPLTQPTAQAATIVRVKPGGSTSAGCGSTWATACELQTALTAAVAGTEIWVAAGIYKPGTNREDTFQLKSGVALYGGFAGTETAREQRDWEAHLTVLSGDIGVEDDISDNNYHVVTGSGVDVTAILDGFTITEGNSEGSEWIHGGGGMYNISGRPSLANMTFNENSGANGGGMRNEGSSPTLTNVFFISNEGGSGGGMQNLNGNPVLTNVTFSGNSALDNGGGMSNFNDSKPSLTNVTFTNNSAWYGGGMFNSFGNPVLTNVTFSGNSAAREGGGMKNEGSSNPTLVDVIFSGNDAKNSGGGIYNISSGPSLINAIFSRNEADYGGGMCSDYSSPKLTNVTFSSNHAYTAGGGVSNGYTTSLYITNTILWGNTAGKSDPQISNTSSTSFIQYSDVQGGCASIPGNDCSGGGNIAADPLFVRKPDPGPDGSWGTADDDYGDLRLRYGSPAIDAGNNTVPGLAGITTDLDGNPRFYDVPGIADTGVGPAPVVDMGAYEAVDVGPLEVYLPIIIR